MDLDYGDVPTWLAGIGAFIAVAYAKRAADATRDMLAVEARRDAERAESDAQQQAGLVSAWYGFFPGHPEATMGSHNDFWGAYVRNTSPLPVYDLRIEFFFKGRDEAVIGPRGSLTEGTVPPTESPRFFQAPLAMLRNVEQRDVYVVALTFRDSAGRRWRREHDGVLTEAD